MIQFPIAPGHTVIIIEPGNIRRLKEGRPLIVELLDGSSMMVCYTPDLKRFAQGLGLDQMPKKGERFVIECKITPEQLDSTLKACQHLDEVE